MFPERSAKRVSEQTMRWYCTLAQAASDGNEGGLREIGDQAKVLSTWAPREYSESRVMDQPAILIPDLNRSDGPSSFRHMCLAGHLDQRDTNETVGVL